MCENSRIGRAVGVLPVPHNRVACISLRVKKSQFKFSVTARSRQTKTTFVLERALEHFVLIDCSCLVAVTYCCVCPRKCAQLQLRWFPECAEGSHSEFFVRGDYFRRVSMLLLWSSFTSPWPSGNCKVAHVKKGDMLSKSHFEEIRENSCEERGASPHGTHEMSRTTTTGRARCICQDFVSTHDEGVSFFLESQTPWGHRTKSHKHPIMNHSPGTQ